MNASVFGNKPGFTIIEVMVAIVLIGLLATIVIPNLRPRTAQAQRKQFIAQLNALVAYGWQQAMVTHKVHGVEFDLTARTVSLFKQMAPATATKQEQRAKVPGGFSPSTIPIPATLTFTQFTVEGFDELSRFATKKTRAMWFYIVPEGLAQSVSITFKDRLDVGREKSGTPFTFVLNPFLAQFNEKV